MTIDTNPQQSILALAEAATDAATKEKLQSLASADSYTTEVSRKRVSVLDLLERHPSIQLPFSSFLALLPPMRVRQYSISSSPLWNPGHVTLTYSVLESPALANPANKHIGVATSYLAGLEVGDKLNVSVRPSHSAFHLPVNPEKTPVVMIAAGSGLAPFRGFVQERAAQVASGRDLAPAVLFFGCRDPEQDDIYRAELDRWEKMGAVSVRRAYSRVEHEGDEGEESKGCKYVQDRLWVDREELCDLWDRGAKVYVCGSRGLGEGVKDTVVRIAVERRRRDGKGGKVAVAVGEGEGEGEGVSAEERALKWFESIRNERYATDVFD